ncbi:hypothetical protein LXM63_04295 [Chryseobacterium gleum]|uniref:hypothetical protein n=1 Tax=Chryseobacterium gleum TaxID=250 RepID=UPI001E5B50B7|nr:hypothetical protein [Chryseobacterium gleum]MCE4064302.1 hypothetical protein [Chryseobacterium gleum]
MEFKGTKGQWKTGIFSNTSVYVPAGATICQMLPTDFRQLSDRERDEIRLEIKANALLISKAPEMLDFLIKLRQEWEEDDLRYGGENFHMEEITNLIKEATEI